LRVLGDGGNPYSFMSTSTDGLRDAKRLTIRLSINEPGRRVKRARILLDDRSRRFARRKRQLVASSI
jgi:hypothetical protein